MANNITADVSLNIRELMRIKKISKDVEFAKELGISKQLLSKWKSRNTYDIDKIVDRFPEVSKVWLLTGEGSMLKSESAAHRVENNVRPILVGEKEWADVPLVPFSARAGALSGFGDPQWLEDKQTMQVLVDSRLKGDYVLFEVEGDSMDDGSRDSFLDGDVLLCRVVPQSDWQYSIKKRRATFCVLATKQDGIALKQITKHDRVKQVITCHSLNPAYDDYEVALSDVQAIFYVEELNKRVY